jgi:DNA-binding Xre family transcriptional regulator
MTFGELVQQHLKEHEWTVKRLAAETGLSFWTVYRIKTGYSRQPRIDNVIAICHALGIDLNELASMGVER